MMDTTEKTIILDNEAVSRAYRELGLSRPWKKEWEVAGKKATVTVEWSIPWQMYMVVGFVDGATVSSSAAKKHEALSLVSDVTLAVNREIERRIALKDEDDTIAQILIDLGFTNK